MHSYLALFLFCFVRISSAGILDIFRPDNWNALKVKWGPHPFGNFNSMPRTASRAVRDGFVATGECDADSNFRGVPYVKRGDKSIVLLYDVNGYIAGIQTVIPKGLPNNYPTAGLTPPFVEKDDGFYLTAYFVPPESICTTGRTIREFDRDGTGSKLLIQNGPNPESDYATVPLRQSDLRSTNWVEGKCFISMGKHYWYDISRDMNCDSFFPVFLMYNNGNLNGFGWAIGADLTSSKWEHPPSRLYGLFMKEPPQCLYTRGKLSTMHIFLDSRPALNLC